MLALFADGLAWQQTVAPRAPSLHPLVHRRTPPIVAAGADPTLTVDVAVIGGGPAGLTMASLLQEKHGHSVALVEPRPEIKWPNNYGEWRVEWQALAQRLDMPELMSECVNRDWKVTDTFFGGSWGTEWTERTRLDRAYVQVDRNALKQALRARFDRAGGVVLPTSLRAKTTAPNLFDRNVAHDASGSTLTLADGIVVRASLVLDASGFESTLVARESDDAASLWKPLPPGYQIAYGFTCDIEGSSLGPYAQEAMTLFDYRTDHLEAAAARGGPAEAAALADAETRPSFMYVMPEGPVSDGEGEGCVRAFFEETSLVGRGERRLEFGTLKQRALCRLKHLGMTIRPGSVQEEEYCYIPMGGNLPDLGQRIVAVGGAAATVHPSTGYQLCRMLASSTDLASALSAQLSSDGFDPDVAAAAGYRALWTPQLRYQRDFQVFGGEFLGDQPVEYLRGFFAAFFQLPTDTWGGFLAGWPGLPGNEYHDAWNKRLLFGLQLFVKFPPAVALAMMVYAVQFSLEYGPLILRSFATPLFGADGGVKPLDRAALRTRLEATYVTGDMEAKREAIAMLREGNGHASPQVELAMEGMDVEERAAAAAAAEQREGEEQEVVGVA